MTIPHADRKGVQLFVRADGFIIGRHWLPGALGTTPKDLRLDPAATIMGTIHGPGESRWSEESCAARIFPRAREDDATHAIRRATADTART